MDLLNINLNQFKLKLCKLPCTCVLTILFNHLDIFGSVEFVFAGGLFVQM